MKKAFPAVTILAAACSAAPQTERTLGAANPASVHCVELGGRVEIRNEDGGQVGYCHLPDGRVVEEWTLFRADVAKT